jgi:SEL1 protein
MPSPMARIFHRHLLLAVVTLAVAASLLRPAAAVRPFVLVLSGEDFLKDPAAHPSLPSADSDDDDGWDDFADDSPAADPLLSPSSWAPLLDPTISLPSGDETDSPADALFVAGAREMLSAASDGDDAAFTTAAAQIEASAEAGHPGAQSALAFLTGAGMTRPASRSLAFLLHKFAADAGDLQSKMALAYSYFRQEVWWSIPFTLRSSLGTLVFKWFGGIEECINPNRSKTHTIHLNPLQSLSLLEYPN